VNRSASVTLPRYRIAADADKHERAAEPLREAAKFFCSRARNNHATAAVMLANAKTFEHAADKVETDPEGEVGEE
jgi:hypothetical protein